MYYLLYTLALISLSQSSVIIRWSGTDPMTLGIWRLFLAGSILYAWSWRRHTGKKVSTNDWRKIIAAAFAFFVHLYTYAYSAHHTSISHLMLIFSLNPVTTAMGSWIFFKERMTPRQGVAYVLALLGIYILAREKQGGAQIEGDMVAIISAVTFSAYAILSKWARRDLSNSIMSSRMYFAGAIFFLLGAILSGAPLLPVTDKGLIGIALLTVFPTLMGHGIFTLVMNHIPLYVLSLGKLIEPGIAAISAYFLFAESLSMAALASSALIVSAVVLVVMKKNK